MNLENLPTLWTSRNGSTKPIAEMDDAHLVNACNMMLRSVRERVSELSTLFERWTREEISVTTDVFYKRLYHRHWDLRNTVDELVDWVGGERHWPLLYAVLYEVGHRGLRRNDPEKPWQLLVPKRVPPKPAIAPIEGMDAESVRDFVRRVRSLMHTTPSNKDFVERHREVNSFLDSPLGRRLVTE